MSQLSRKCWSSDVDISDLHLKKCPIYSFSHNILFIPLIPRSFIYFGCMLVQKFISNFTFTELDRAIEFVIPDIFEMNINNKMQV